MPLDMSQSVCQMGENEDNGCREGEGESNFPGSDDTVSDEVRTNNSERLPFENLSTVAEPLKSSALETVNLVF